MPAALRVAAYYAPALDDPLWQAGCTWLGRVPETAAALTQPDVPGIAEATAEPRGYGFHATLKPPFRLRGCYDWDDVMSAAQTVADRVTPFDLPPLKVADVKGFLALRECRACPPLQALADTCVTELDELRQPPEPDELARRRRAPLTPEQDALLVRWGYPYVFDSWFFHMTLTRRLGEDERAIFTAAAAAHFDGLLDRARRVADLCLFVQPAPGADFTIAERFALRG